MMTASPPPSARRVALCSAVAETSRVVSLLKEHGFTVKIQKSANATADVILPTPRGSLAWVLLHSRTDDPHLVDRLMERAAVSARASRRCSLVWVRPPSSASADLGKGLQLHCPVAVDIITCDTNEEAVEHMLACVHKCLATAAVPASEQLEHSQYVATERVSLHLARQWNVEQHQIDFLCASKPLSALAQVGSEAEWRELLLEMDGLVDGGLLEYAVEWLRFDAKQLW